MKIYPANGLQTRDPTTKQLLPATGMEVPAGDLFYAHRLRDGDVTLTPHVSAPTLRGKAE